MFLGGIERDQQHEMGLREFRRVSTKNTKAAPIGVL